MSEAENRKTDGEGREAERNGRQDTNSKKIPRFKGSQLCREEEIGI